MTEYKYLNCSNGIPEYVESGDILVECQFSKPVEQSIPGEIIDGPEYLTLMNCNCNNRRIPTNWQKIDCSNAQVQYTKVPEENIYDDSGNIIGSIPESYSGLFISSEAL